MKLDGDTYYPGGQVDQMRRASWRWGALAGFWIGVLFMAFSDITDLHICMGECDAAGREITP